MNGVNLIPQQRRVRQTARRRSRSWVRFLRAYTVLLAAGCGLAMLPAHASSSNESNLARLERRHDALAERLAKLKTESTDLSRRLELAAFVGNHPDWSALLQALSRSRGEHVALEAVELTTTRPAAKPGEPARPGASGPKEAPAQEQARHTVKVVGYANDAEEALAFAKRVEKLGVAEPPVVLKDTRSEAVGSRSVAKFEIEINFEPAASGKTKDGGPR